MVCRPPCHIDNHRRLLGQVESADIFLSAELDATGSTTAGLDVKPWLARPRPIDGAQAPDLVSESRLLPGGLVSVDPEDQDATMPRVADRVVKVPAGDEFLPKFVASLDPEWIEEALVATGTATIRRRRLPAQQVVWLVIGMCIFRDLSMRDLVSTMDTRWNSTSGYPLVRLVTLMALRSHILAGARFGAYATSEGTLAEQLWPLLPDHSLAIVDRGFL
jgi:hypothetical protein